MRPSPPSALLAPPLWRKRLGHTAHALAHHSFPRRPQVNYSFWYNPADGAQQAERPDFHWYWQVRKARSAYQETKGGLEMYFDPLTNQRFQYHPLTDSYN